MQVRDGRKPLRPFCTANRTARPSRAGSTRVVARACARGQGRQIRWGSRGGAWMQVSRCKAICFVSSHASLRRQA